MSFIRQIAAGILVLLPLTGLEARTSLHPDLYSVERVTDQGFEQLEFTAHKRMLLITEPVNTPVPFTPSDSFRVALDPVNAHEPEFVGEALPVNTRASGYDQGSIQRGDFDGDGFTDLFVVSGNWQSVFIVMGSEANIPGRVVYFSDEDISRFKSGYTLASVNGDGVTDIFFASSGAKNTVYNFTDSFDYGNVAELLEVGVFYDDNYIAVKESTLAEPAGLFYTVNELTGDLLVSQSIRLPMSKGVAPQINISYSSAFSVGGREWSISSVSKISECHQRDGTHPYNERKKNLCLDGQLLVKNGLIADEYVLRSPSPGNYLVVTDLQNGKYKVNDGAGKVKIYGDSSSRLGKVSYISSITGIYGETINYNYDNGLLDSINYGVYEVDVKYAEMDDHLYHINGYTQVGSTLGSKSSGRLSEIEVKDGDEVISRKSFYYENEPEGRLLSIQQCYYSPAEECEEPYYFDYHEGFFDAREYTLDMPLNEFGAADFTSLESNRLTGQHEITPMAILGKVTMRIFYPDVKSDSLLAGRTDPDQFNKYKSKTYDFESGLVTLSDEYQYPIGGDPFVFTAKSDVSTFSFGLTSAEGVGETGDSGFLLQGDTAGTCDRNGDDCHAPVIWDRDGVARLIESDSSGDLFNLDFQNSSSGMIPSDNDHVGTRSAFKRHDFNKDGISTFMSAYVFYQGDYEYIGLGVVGVANQSEPYEIILGRYDQLADLGFSSSDIEIYGPFDFDYDGNTELYIDLSLDYDHIVEIGSDGEVSLTQVNDANDFGILKEDSIIYGDFNGDALTDAIAVSGNQIEYYSGIYRDGAVIKYGNVAQLGNVPGATVSIGDKDVTNILSIDYDRDGKDELWIGGVFYSISELSIKQDRKTDEYTFSCTSVECLKIADYDKDGVPEIFEWESNKIVVHKIVAKRKQIHTVTYDGQTLFEANYRDVMPEIEISNNFLFPVSYNSIDPMFLMKKQKVLDLNENDGVNGWSKRSYNYEVAAFSGMYSGYGYKEVSIEKYSSSEVANTPPVIDKLVYADKNFGKLFNDRYYISRVDRSYYRSGLIESTVPELYYELRGGGDNNYVIETRLKEEVLGPVTTKLAKRELIFDKYGRFVRQTSNLSGAEVEIEHVYEYPDWPSFISKSIYTYLEANEPFSDTTEYIPLEDKPLPWITNFHVGNSELEYKEEREYHDNYDIHKVVTSVGGSLSSSIEDRVTIYKDFFEGLPKTIENKASGQKISKEYDIFGREVFVGLNGHEISYSYDSLGRPLTETDNTGRSVSYQYDKCNHDCVGGASYVASSTSSTGAVRETFVDITRFVAGEHSYNKSTGESVYSMRKLDGLGRLKEEYRNVETLDGDAPYTYVYFSSGGLKRTTEPGPLQSDDTRDSIEVSYIYESQSGESFCGGAPTCLKKTKVRDQVSTVVAGEVIVTPERRNVSYIQESNGRPVRIESAGGVIKHFGYDAFGNISSVKESGKLSGDTSDGNVELVFKRTFNINGMVVASERPGRGSQYKDYTPFGEILKETYASGDTVSYAYDGAGRISSKVYSGTSDLAKRSYSWVYDSEVKGMLDEIRYHDSADINSWVSIYEYDYDEYGRPEVERNNLSQAPLVRSFEYNSQGLPDSVSMSAMGAPASVMKLVSSYQGGVLSGASVASYNSDSNEEELQPLWSVSEWDFKGRQLSVDYFNSAISLDLVRDRYRSTLLRKNLSHSDHGVLDGEDVYFDTHGDPRLKVGIEDAETSDSLVLSYDNDQRLTSVDDRMGMLSSSYSMDDFGNFNYKDRSGNSYSYDLNESATESSVDSGSITYGKLEDGTYTGHMSNVGGYVLTHNEKGQPSTITSAEGSVTFTYGPYDELVSVDYSSGETLQLWGGMQVSTGSDHGTFYRFRVGDLVLIRGDVEGDFITYTDYLGSERSIWNSAGQLIASATYDAYGKKVLSTNMQGYDFVSERGYTSHLDLKGFSFVHMKNRLYSPEFGLFTSIDPVFDSAYRTGGLNGYGYVSGSPFRSIDPSGMVLVDITEYEMSNVSGAPNLEQWAQDLVNNSMPIAPVVNVDTIENDTIEVNVSNGLDTAINSAEEILGNPLPSTIATTGSLILATNNSVLTNSGTRIPTLPLTYGMDIENYNKAVGASKNLYITGNVLGYGGLTLSTYQYIDAVDSNDWDRARKVSTTAFYSALMMSPPWLITIPIGLTGVWVTNNDGSLIP